MWHIDGYDKLKPYGFPIHGCIDGSVKLHDLSYKDVLICGCSNQIFKKYYMAYSFQH